MPRDTVLIVGVGSIGERHLRCFAATGRVRVALAEPHADLRAAIADKYGVERVYASASEALTELALHDEPLAAVIATPAPSHVPLAAMFVASGVAVLIEKPLATTLEGVAELQALADERGVAAAVAYVYRQHPALAAMRHHIVSGAIGRPVQLVVTAGQHFPTYRPAYRHIYYRDRAQGGGAIQDALTHLVNAAEWLVGPVDRLCCDADHKVLDGVTVEDTVHLLTRHGQAMGAFALNQHQAPNETTITVVGETGTVRFEYHNCRWSEQRDPVSDWTHHGFGPLERDALFVAQATSFLSAVARQAPPACSLADGARTLRVNLAALTSAADRRWVELTE